MSTPLDDGMLSNGDVIETIHISQLFPIVEALEDNQTNYREDVGVADAYKVDFSGAGSNPNQVIDYQAGQQILFKAAHDNTGPSTLQVTGPSGDLSALDLKKFGNSALEAGDIQAGQMVMAIYNDEGSGRFEMMGGAPVTVELPDPEDGTGFYRDDEGSSDFYVVDASGSGDNPRPISALTKGLFITFKATQNNSGSSALEVMGPSGSLGAKLITKRGEDLEAGDIVANTMVAVIYSDQSGGRFELLGSIPAGGGGAGTSGFYGCQSVLDSDVQIFANSETNIEWDSDDISQGLSSSAEWIFVDQAGYYEVGLVLAMELTDPDSLLVEMQKYHSSSSWTVVRNEVDAAAGLATFSFDPVVIQLAAGDGVKWMVTSSLADPTIKSGDLRTRCSVKLVTNVASPESTDLVCMVSKGGGEGLGTNSETPINFDGDEVDPQDLHDSGEWLDASVAGFYEVGLVLSMEMTAAESLEVRLVKDDGSSETMISLNEMDAPSGLNMFSLTPVLLELEEGDRVKWTVTATLDTPTIRGSDFRTRCSFKYLGPSS